MRAIARSHAWQELLDSGELSSIGSLATPFHVDHSYVARTLRLASLSPDIVEKIVAGNEPSGLSLRRLMKGFPSRWDEQRDVLSCKKASVYLDRIARRGGEGTMASYG